ncbi:MAG: integrase core domain-containing protein [Mycobacterium sp.]
MDNAAAESFNSTLEWELLRNNRFHGREQARHAVAVWIDDYKSQRRPHSTNGMLSPIDYEHTRTQRRPQQPIDEHTEKGAA